MALASLHQRDDALDAVQEAMFKLVEKYRNKPADQWPPLFYRILYSRITDIQRSRTRSGKLFSIFAGRSRQGEESSEELMATFSDPANPDPARLGDDEKFGDRLDHALQELPQRQRQAFMLRAWEGLDVAQTAVAMGCGEGSVKTHYSRARQFLQRKLADFVEPEATVKQH